MNRFLRKKKSKSSQSSRRKVSKLSPTPKSSEESSETRTEPPSDKEILMNAAKSGDEEAILSLYNKASNLCEVDNDGNNALHIAALNGHQPTCRMLVVLTAPHDLWNSRNREGKTPIELTTCEDVKEDLQMLMTRPRYVPDVHMQFNDNLVNRKVFWDDEDNLLLSLDGGGIRALISMQILIHLEHRLFGNLCDYVDWMAGTSCGGLIALVLATGRSVDATRRIVWSNRLRVFCGNENAKFPKHDTAGIDGVCQDVFNDVKMSQIKRMKVMVTTADCRKSPPSLILFRSYAPKIPQAVKEEYSYMDPERILCRKAARCTSAAPYFFESYHGLSDGGIVANNPTLPLMTDFFRYYKLEDAHGARSDGHRQKLGCVVSIGTGTNPAELTEGIDFNWKRLNKKNPWQLARGVVSAISSARNIFEVLIKEVTASNGQPARYAREWCHSLDVPYFRFSPKLNMPHSLDNIHLHDIIDMLWDTELYIYGDGRHGLNQLARLIYTKKRHEKLDCLIQPKEVRSRENIFSQTTATSTKSSKTAFSDFE